MKSVETTYSSSNTGLARTISSFQVHPESSYGILRPYHLRRHLQVRPSRPSGRPSGGESQCHQVLPRSHQPDDFSQKGKNSRFQVRFLVIQEKYQDDGVVKAEHLMLTHGNALVTACLNSALFSVSALNCLYKNNGISRLRAICVVIWPR